MSLQYLACAAITAISAFVSLGFSVVSVVRPEGGARTTALFVCVRCLSLAILAVVPFISHSDQSDQWLLAIAVGMTLVQALDAGVGYRTRDTLKTVGPTVTAAINLAAIAWFVS